MISFLNPASTTQGCYGNPYVISFFLRKKKFNFMRNMAIWFLSQSYGTHSKAFSSARIQVNKVCVSSLKMSLTPACLNICMNTELQANQFFFIRAYYLKFSVNLVLRKYLYTALLQMLLLLFMNFSSKISRFSQT